MPVDFPALHDSSVADLRDRASELGIEEADQMRRLDLVFAIGRRLGAQEQITYGSGVIEVHGEGFGFLRSAQGNFLPGPAAIYVSQSQIRRFKLQTGDTGIGQVRPPKEGERYVALLRVESVNGERPGAEPQPYDSLTAIYPDDRIRLSDDQHLRALDLAAPMGLGQRGILVEQIVEVGGPAAPVTQDEDRGFHHHIAQVENPSGSGAMRGGAVADPASGIITHAIRDS